MQSNLYKYLLIKVIPFIRFSLYYTKLKGFQYIDGYKYLSPGDILLTVDYKKLTHYLIPGEFSHAALCVGIGNEIDPKFEIAEMTHENYTKSFFFDLCKEADRVVILRCNDWDNDYKKLVIQKCLSFENAVYDLEFDLGVKALYCSELVYQSDIEHRLQVDLTDLEGLGRPYISPTGLYQAKNIKVIWDSNGKQRQ